MACVDIGRLRAYCDGEIPRAEAALLEEHVAECARCKAELDDVRQTGTFVYSRLATLAPLEVEPPVSTRASLASLRRKMEPQPDSSTVAGWGWFGSLLANTALRWRFAASGLTALVVVIALIALPPVRSMAVELLGVFRVQKFTPVTVDPSTVSNIPMVDPTQMGTIEGLTAMPTVHYGLSPVEAGAKVDFALRLPSRLPAGAIGDPNLGVMEGFSVAYTFDYAKAQAYLESLGLKGVNLPKSPSGKKISATVPTRVFASYGNAAGGRALQLIEGRSPAVDIPDGVDVEEVRNMVLSYPGLPPELVAQLRTIDWKTTAPVPVIKGDTSQTVTVDGVEGLLVRSDTHEMTAILWQKEDIVYILVGPLAQDELVDVANSLK